MDDQGLWTPWVDLGGPVSLKTPNAVLFRGSPQPTLTVIDAGTDRQLIYRTYVEGEGWREWRNAEIEIGGTGVAAVPSHALAMVFGLDTNQAAWMLPALSAAPGGLHSWPGHQVFPDPVAISDDKTIEVFVRRKEDRAVWNLTRVWGQSWWREWRSLGGSLTSSLAVGRSNESLRLFARGDDGALWWNYQTNAVWRNTWERIGGQITSAPAVFVDARGLDHVFARGASGALVYTSRDALVGSWAKWTPVVPDDSVRLDSAPLVCQYPESDLAAVFVLAEDLTIWWLLFGPSGLKTSWQKIPPPPNGGGATPPQRMGGIL
jgi:hypothetical protein